MIKLFTHDDLDGIGCAILAKLAYGNNVDFSCCSHDKINEMVEDCFNNADFEEVHITDISVNQALAYKIDVSQKPYMMLDHHRTALNLNQYSWCKIEINNEEGLMTSGTELYYKWLVNNQKLNPTKATDDFVEIVRNYDTWRWAELGESGAVSKDVNDVLDVYRNILGIEYFVDWAIHCITTLDTFPHFYDSEKLMLKIKHKEIEAYTKEKESQMLVAKYGGKNVGLIFADKYFNDISHAIAKDHPEVDYIAMVDAGRGAVSLRTEKDGVDLGAIAKSFGGGGHTKAAGFRFNANIIAEMFGNVFHGLFFEKGC